MKLGERQKVRKTAPAHLDAGLVDPNLPALPYLCNFVFIFPSRSGALLSVMPICLLFFSPGLDIFDVHNWSSSFLLLYFFLFFFEYFILPNLQYWFPDFHRYQTRSKGKGKRQPTRRAASAYQSLGGYESEIVLGASMPRK
jgi:hypothetical protein